MNSLSGAFIGGAACAIGSKYGGPVEKIARAINTGFVSVWTSFCFIVVYTARLGAAGCKQPEIMTELPFSHGADEGHAEIAVSMCIVHCNHRAQIDVLSHFCLHLVLVASIALGVSVSSAGAVLARLSVAWSGDLQTRPLRCRLDASCREGRLLSSRALLYLAS